MALKCVLIEKVWRIFKLRLFHIFFFAFETHFTARTSVWVWRACVRRYKLFNQDSIEVYRNEDLFFNFVLLVLKLKKKLNLCLLSVWQITRPWWTTCMKFRRRRRTTWWGRPRPTTGTPARRRASSSLASWGLRKAWISRTMTKVNRKIQSGLNPMNSKYFSS